jgi:hypothetical protein
VQSKLNINNQKYKELISEKQQTAHKNYLKEVSDIIAKANRKKSSVAHYKGFLGSIKYKKIKAEPFIMKLKPIYNFSILPKNLLTNNNTLCLNIGLENKVSENMNQGIGFNNNIGFNIQKTYYLKYDNAYLFYYINHHIIWGIALQGGYEYNIFSRNSSLQKSSSSPRKSEFINIVTQNNQNIAYIGLVKSYNLNTKWQGNLLVGYDFLWNGINPNKNSPWLIRLSIKKR